MVVKECIQKYLFDAYSLGKLTTYVAATVAHTRPSAQYASSPMLQEATPVIRRVPKSSKFSSLSNKLVSLARGTCLGRDFF